LGGSSWRNGDSYAQIFFKIHDLHRNQGLGLCVAGGDGSEAGNNELLVMDWIAHPHILTVLCFSLLLVDWIAAHGNWGNFYFCPTLLGTSMNCPSLL
jgi:hypothetical protein